MSIGYGPRDHALDDRGPAGPDWTLIGCDVQGLESDEMFLPEQIVCSVFCACQDEGVSCMNTCGSRKLVKSNIETSPAEVKSFQALCFLSF